jgi:hypothetical protein
MRELHNCHVTSMKQNVITCACVTVRNTHGQMNALLQVELRAVVHVRFKVKVTSQHYSAGQDIIRLLCNTKFFLFFFTTERYSTTLFASSQFNTATNWTTGFRSPVESNDIFL